MIAFGAMAWAAYVAAIIMVIIKFFQWAVEYDKHHPTPESKKTFGWLQFYMVVAVSTFLVPRTPKAPYQPKTLEQIYIGCMDENLTNRFHYSDDDAWLVSQLRARDFCAKKTTAIYNIRLKTQPKKAPNGK